ncbi:MAG: CocE/NonD family hydrolase [Thermoplasmatota archaeon]
MRLPLVALALLLSGCLAGIAPAATTTGPVAPYAPTLPSLKLGSILPVTIPVDGAVLRGSVFLPAVPNGTKVPVLMDLGPYYSDLGAATGEFSGGARMQYGHFLGRGYAIAQVSLRGTGDSSGCFAIGGPQERADAAAAVEFLAKQPWSDGNVGMIGISYDGTTPWEALVNAPPHLKAIIPIEGISDHYRYSFFDGVGIDGGPSFNTYYYPLVGVLYTGATYGSERNGSAPSWLASPTSKVCPGVLDELANPWETWTNGAHSAFWDGRDAAKLLNRSKAAVLMIHGFDDWNVKMDNVQTLWNDIPSPHRMVLGQWEHDLPWDNTFNHDFNFTAYNATVDTFIDAYVRGDPAALAAEQALPPVVAQDSTGAWSNFTAWPPPPATMTPMYLTAGQSLAAAPTAKSGTFSFRDDVSASSYDACGPGSLQQTALATAAGPGACPLGTKVLFDSGPLAERVWAAGNATFHLNASVNAPEGYVAVAIYDRDPLGGMTRVVPGFLNFEQRKGRSESDAISLNTPMSATVELYAMDYVFQAGHRIVVEVGGTDPNLAWGNSPATVSFTAGGAGGAQLDLPVISGTLPARAT